MSLPLPRLLVLSLAALAPPAAGQLSVVTAAPAESADQPGASHRSQAFVVPPGPYASFAGPAWSRRAAATPQHPLQHDPGSGETLRLPAIRPGQGPLVHPGSGPVARPGDPPAPGGWELALPVGPVDAGDPDWSARCRLISTFPDGTTYQTSGTLISANTVITAGHAVHQGPDGDWATQVIVSPAWDGDDDLASSELGSSLVTWPGWTEDGDPAHDQGYVRLDRPIGFLAGWLGFAAQSDSFLEGVLFSVAGYPTSPCWSGAPDQLIGALGTWDSVQDDLLTTSTVDWPCWIGGMDGASAFHIQGSGQSYVDGNLAYGAGSQAGTHSLGVSRLTASKFSFLLNGYVLPGYPSTLDLEPLRCRANEEVVELGATTLLSFALCNTSTADPPPLDVGVTVRLSTNDVLSTADTVIDQFDVSVDFPGLSATTVFRTVSIPTHVAPGDYWIGVTLDGPDGFPLNDDSSGWDADPIRVIDDHPYEDLGGALPGLLGPPRLLASGSLTTGSANAVLLEDAHPSATASLFFSFVQSSVPFKGGVLQALTLPSPFIPVTTQTSALGTLTIPYTLDDPLPAGVEFFLQWVIADPFAVSGFSISNAVRALTP